MDGNPSARRAEENACPDRTVAGLRAALQQHGSLLRAPMHVLRHADKVYKPKKLKLWAGGQLAAVNTEMELKDGTLLVHFEGDDFAVQGVQPSAVTLSSTAKP